MKWNDPPFTRPKAGYTPHFTPRAAYAAMISKLDTQVGEVIDLVAELVKYRKEGIRVAAYGAAAKGNTLLNYSGIDSDLIEYVVDLNPHKPGSFLPGSRIPIVSDQVLNENPPDVLLVLPWNIIDEVKLQLNQLSGEGMKFLRAIPRLEYI
jgi:hypothetical protein